MPQAAQFRFALCSKESIAFALDTIADLHNNNEKEKRHYRSFQSLRCSRDDLKRSFYFLKDCIHFCKHEVIYGNTNLLNSLSELEIMVVLTYIDVPSDSIPNEMRENFAFGSRFELDKNLDVKQLTELALVDWRFREHWEFWADKYGKESLLGRFCQEKARQSVS